MELCDSVGELLGDYLEALHGHSMTLDLCAAGERSCERQSWLCQHRRQMQAVFQGEHSSLVCNYTGLSPTSLSITFSFEVALKNLKP